jgi:peroxiredoxin
MVALAEGTKAPDFELTSVDGGSYSLAATLKDKPLVLLAFFKVSCPVCQLIAPYLERLHRSHPNLPIWGVSQDDKDATEAFARMFGCTFTMLLDETLGATVDYDLTNVPSLFLVDKNGTIVHTIVGFVKGELERLNVELSGAGDKTLVPLFTLADEVPELKPG